jgi:hypothetical protein
VQGENHFKHYVARAIYLSSFGLLIGEIAVYFLSSRDNRPNQEQFFAIMLFTLMKPILIVNGKTNQLVVVLCLVQLIALRTLVAGARVKPSQMWYAMTIQCSIWQYFYRTSHRESISSIQFGKAFLGFTEYHFQLHGALVVINTYSAYLIAFFMLPILTKTTKPATGGTPQDLSLN